MAVRLLLISGTGKPPFSLYHREIREFLHRPTKVGFVTAARLGDEAAYFSEVRNAFLDSPDGALMRDFIHVRWDRDWKRALEKLDAVIIGGGNTYVLLKRLLESRLLDALATQVNSGLAYLGSSAGSNLAGPNILTTNDWNVVGLTSFDALGFVPFNINPHYIERGVDAPWSETRDQRIHEYLAVWNNPVVGLEEGTLLRVEHGIATVQGQGRVKLFGPQQPPRWLGPGEQIDAEINRDATGAFSRRAR